MKRKTTGIKVMKKKADDKRFFKCIITRDALVKNVYFLLQIFVDAFDLFYSNIANHQRDKKEP